MIFGIEKIGMEDDKAMDIAIGRYIRKYRKRKNMTQKQLANEVGKCQSMIAHWENGTKRIGLVDAVVIFKILGADMSDFKMPSKKEE